MGRRLRRVGWGGVVAVLLAAAATAATSAPRAAKPAPARAPAKAMKKTETVIGYGGRVLIVHRPAGEVARELIFEQVARSDTRGLVLEANKNFYPQRLPATFAATLDDGVFCTATRIGPQVLLTAAHCVDLDSKTHPTRAALGSVRSADGREVRRIRNCELAPAYVADRYRIETVRNSNDYALCELEDAMSGQAETISVRPEDIVAGAPILLAGYGCTNGDLVDNEIVPDAPSEKLLRVGETRLSGVGKEGWVEAPGRARSGQAVICPGDSGGAAYAGAQLDETSDYGWRVVAVNSAVGPVGPRRLRRYISYLAPLADPDFQTFLTTWTSARPEVRGICGVGLDYLSANCRR